MLADGGAQRNHRGRLSREGQPRRGDRLNPVCRPSGAGKAFSMVSGGSTAG
jgi:hypothetical protein